MKRRHAIHKTGWILSSAIFGPGLLTALQGCASEANIPDQPLVLNSKQFQLTKALADTILPRTSSPSASDVKVPEFMDLLCKDVFEEDARQHFLDGLAVFDNDCVSVGGKSFHKLSPEAQYDYLVDMDRMVMEKSYTDKIPFYYTFKKLCIAIYYSTEEGIKQNLNYNPIPGGFQGDVPWQAGDKIEVGNEM
ncbi:MAG: gluconate 2-dehydrogenase subunit 3 family protein [Saprospiraceae bacterium]|nr:gluconate 2-dehydrogenase subunit 3 family protein [Saprospiraceae bacterium]